MSQLDVGPPRSFDLDDFQVAALGHLDAGRSVVVSAPTGSGKTYVAEYAIDAARLRGKRSVYTTPIKALSNQKYRDLRAWLGHDSAGLLTGDNSINGDGQAVVMTTEVLRNMLYAEPERLRDIDVVVMDEVHYLQNTFRGPVWEEVIIHLPEHIQIVALSATVSNADELADWIGSVHGPCSAVTETTRPVRLSSSFMVGEKGNGRRHVVPTLKKGRPNPEGRRFDGQNNGGRRQRHGDRQRRQPYRTPRRSEVVEELERRGLLPVITFIFSRAGCEDAVSQLRQSGVHLTDAETEELIVDYVERRTADLSEDDKTALGYSTWLRGLRSGLAAHHAGIVPLFKETVEELFAKGYLRAIFATETLALGINMPARTVVIERLTKFTGERHELLTPADYTQLTGRAGRRGIDDEGHAFVLWTPFTEFGEVVSLARSKSFELRSAFRPTYNMACHLVGRYTRAQAEELVEKSFGQFQTNAEILKLEERRERVARDLQRASGAEADPTPDSPYNSDIDHDAIIAEINRLKPGDVVDLGPEIVAVLSNTWRRKEVRVRVIEANGESHILDPEALTTVPVTVGQVRLPEPFNPNSRSHHHEISGQLRGVRRSGKSKRAKARAKNAKNASSTQEGAAHSVWKGTASNDLARDLRRLDARIAERRGRLTERFRSVVGLLSELGYVENWELTEHGSLLLGTFHELDLALCESIRAGHMDGHSAPELAALLSVFVYEARNSEDAPPWCPNESIEHAAGQIADVITDVQRRESAYGLPESRSIDPGLVAATYGWASGGGLVDVLSTEILTPGDFVRSMRQVIDILSQLAHVAPNSDTRRTARQAKDLLQRGIVEATVDDLAGESADAIPDSS